MEPNGTPELDPALSERAIPATSATQDVTPVLPRNSKSGRGDWIRTSDPLRPRQVRYQAALRPDRREVFIIPHRRTTSFRARGPLTRGRARHQLRPGLRLRN